jgi:hypothetical protein
MSPWKLEQFVQKCGKWIYSADQNHPDDDKRLWLAPAVLTPTNPDKTNPQIPIEDARAVFDTLEKRNLLTPRLAAVTDANNEKREVVVYFVNREKKKDWETLVSKSGFLNMKASPVIYYFFGSENPWGFLILTFVLASFFGEIFKGLGGDFYTWICKSLAK